MTLFDYLANHKQDAFELIALIGTAIFFIVLAWRR